MKLSVQRRFAPVLYVTLFFAGFFTACLWFNPQDYLAELPLTLTAVAAVAAIWLVYAVVSVKAAQQQEMWRREQLIQQESIQPVLHVAIQCLDDKPEMLVLAVRNSGKGMAKNVRLQVVEPQFDTPATMAVAEAIRYLPILANGVDCLAAGDTYGGIFADIRSLAEEVADVGFVGNLTLSMTCQNIFGDGVQTETILDLSLLNHNIPPQVENKSRKTLLY